MNDELIEQVVLLTALWERDTIVRAIPHSVAKEIIALVSASNHKAVKEAMDELPKYNIGGFDRNYHKKHLTYEAIEQVFHPLKPEE